MPLAEHDVVPNNLTEMRDVSIHVPLAEHDFDARMNSANTTVSIHVPLAEHDRVISCTW